MKGNHIKIEKDSLLLKHLYAEVKEKLEINNRRFLFRLWLKFLFYLLITAGSYYSLFFITDTSTFILTYTLYGFLALVFAFNFAHDLSHDSIFKSKKLNNLCYTLLYTMVGAHAEAWKVRHVQSHHYCPNVDGQDADMKITKWIRVIPSQKYYSFHKYQHYYASLLYMTYSLFWIVKKDFVNYFWEEEYKIEKNLNYHLIFWLQKITYLIIILVIPLVYFKVSWQVIAVSFFVMHAVQSIFLLYTFFMTHHVKGSEYPTTKKDGTISTSWIMNQIKSSNDMHPFSKTANFIMGGFNNHIAHHLFPNIHHLHYIKLNRILYPFLIERGIIPNQTTYWGGIVGHLQLLKQRSTFNKN